MPYVEGTPDFPFYMPFSDRAYYPEEEALRQKAIALSQRGYQAGVNIHGAGELNKTITGGELYYQTPRVPDHYFVQEMVDGTTVRPPYMVPGNLNNPIATRMFMYGDGYGPMASGETSGINGAQALAMQQVQDEARNRRIRRAR